MKETQVNRCSENNAVGDVASQCCATCRHWPTWNREAVRRCLLDQSFYRGDYGGCAKYEDREETVT